MLLVFGMIMIRFRIVCFLIYYYYYEPNNDKSNHLYVHPTKWVDISYKRFSERSERLKSFV